MGKRGPLACDRCGGRIEQPATGRPRLYCGRTCRELAYRKRAQDDAVRTALKAHGIDPDQDSTTDVAPVPVTSVVESEWVTPISAPWLRVKG